MRGYMAARAYDNVRTYNSPGANLNVGRYLCRRMNNCLWINQNNVSLEFSGHSAQLFQRPPWVSIQSRARMPAYTLRSAQRIVAEATRAPSTLALHSNFQM